MKKLTRCLTEQRVFCVYIVAYYIYSIFASDKAELRTVKPIIFTF